MRWLSPESKILAMTLTGEEKVNFDVIEIRKTMVSVTNRGRNNM